MSKVSIYLDDELEPEIEELIQTHPELTKRNRSALVNLLLKREIEEHKRKQMVEAAAALDELELGWSSEEEHCAIIDMEVSG